MARRVLLVLPVVFLFALVTVIFAAARAPRTWAVHWREPVVLGSGGGQNEYGAVPWAHSWDILWFDDNSQRLLYSRFGRPASTAVVLDHGDISWPSLAVAGQAEAGVWMRAYNGGQDLMAAIRRPGGHFSIHRVLRSSRPMEHPSLFPEGPHRLGLVFSWQRYGLFDIFLAHLDISGHMSTPVRLTHSKSYGFYPRARMGPGAVVNLVHLESCCEQKLWNVDFDRYSSAGRPLAPTHLLFQIGLDLRFGVPSQWGVDLQPDAAGNLWEAVAQAPGVIAFEIAPDGRIRRRPTLLDRNPGIPDSVAVVPFGGGGYLFWEQQHEQGVYLDAQRFDGHLHPVGSQERVAYEAPSETNLHAALVDGRPEVLWQAIGSGTGSEFEMTSYRRAASPSVAQRLGLNLGNPWIEALLLVGGAFFIGVLAASANIGVVLALAIVGLVAIRLWGGRPGKWIVFACLLAAGLYITFIAPGLPTFLLGSLPSQGLPVVPFGLIADAGALALVLWLGAIALKHIDDVYRVGIMAYAGVFFFAFVESLTFVQRGLGSI